MARYRQVHQRFSKVVPLVFWVVCCDVFALAGCDSNSQPVTESSLSRDCLPPLVFADQDGHEVSLASLKGKPLLFDFIYTTCPGPCLMLTARMKAIANDLGSALGSQVTFVSVTVDPEHDGPTALKAYARDQGADRVGWFFLTAPPADVDREMALFKLRRQRDANGGIDHVLEYFIVSRDGRLLKQYLATDANPAKIASDLREVAEGRYARDAS